MTKNQRLSFVLRGSSFVKTTFQPVQRILSRRLQPCLHRRRGQRRRGHDQTVFAVSVVAFAHAGDLVSQLLVEAFGRQIARAHLQRRSRQPRAPSPRRAVPASTTGPGHTPASPDARPRSRCAPHPAAAKGRRTREPVTRGHGEWVTRRNCPRRPGPLRFSVSPRRRVSGPSTSPPRSSSGRSDTCAVSTDRRNTGVRGA